MGGATAPVSSSGSAPACTASVSNASFASTGSPECPLGGDSRSNDSGWLGGIDAIMASPPRRPSARFDGSARYGDPTALASRSRRGPGPFPARSGELGRNPLKTIQSATNSSQRKIGSVAMPAVIDVAVVIPKSGAGVGGVRGGAPSRGGGGGDRGARADPDIRG